MIIGSFGSDIIFYTSSRAVKTFKDLSVSRKARIAKHDILLKKPKLEFQGVDLDAISFSVYLNSGLGVNVDLEIERFYDAFENGVVETLIVGDKFMGSFIIEALNISNISHDRYGNISSCNIDLSVLEYEYD